MPSEEQHLKHDIAGKDISVKYETVLLHHSINDQAHNDNKPPNLGERADTVFRFATIHCLKC